MEKYENLTFLTSKNKSEWLVHRSKGLGGSDVSTLFGLNEYSSQARLLAEKLEMVSPMISNPATYHGSLLEHYIADNIYVYWDPKDPKGYVQNAESGNKTRTCYEVNTAINPKFPWMRANVDRIIPAGNIRLDNGKKLEKDGILEIKTISGYSASKWEDGLPIGYIMQVHLYMIVFELDYSEICVFKDGRDAKIYVINKDEDICNNIISVTKKWYDTYLVPGLELKKRFFASDSPAEKEEINSELNSLLPDADASPDYAYLMSERHTKKIEEYEPDNSDVFMQYGKILHRLIAVKKEVDSAITHTENQVRQEFMEKECEILRLDDDNYFKVTQRKGAKKLTLYNKVQQEDFDAELVVKEFLSEKVY